jgi:tricarballylate dehydrogenase
LPSGGAPTPLPPSPRARELGAEVQLLERAAEQWRGGNSKYTRNIRCVHGEDPVMPGRYEEEELAADLAAVTGEGSDVGLTELAIHESGQLPAWMESHGVRWQPAMRGTLQLSRTNRFFLGGGKALINTYYAAAKRLGVRVAYEHTVEQLLFTESHCVEVRATNKGRVVSIRPRAVVAASGGYESNRAWLREHWGDGVDNYAIRGAVQNDGLVLRQLFAAGALARGNPRGFHAIAVDARAPLSEGGIITRVDSVPFSIVVNRDGRRFYDEGEDEWPKRYATWGRLIAEQPGQLAYSIFDERSLGRFMSTAYPPLRANSLEELARMIDVPAAQLRRTVEDYNYAVRPPAVRSESAGENGDEGHTEGLEPPKSKWALAVQGPPYLAYPLRPGITFTYLGVAVGRDARVLRENGRPFENLFAAGEIMAGNILLRGYLAGFGMTIGTVFGRRAGAEASRV